MARDALSFHFPSREPARGTNKKLGIHRHSVTAPLNRLRILTIPRSVPHHTPVYVTPIHRDTLAAMAGCP